MQDTPPGNYGPPPAGYQQPPPPPGYNQYAQPPPMPKRDTIQGVKFFYWSLMLGLIMVLLAIVTAIAAFATLSAVSAGNAVGGIAAAGTIIALACGIVLIGLLILIFFILGVVRLNRGKNEYPEPHPSSVKKGMLFFVLWIVMFFVGIAVPFIMAPSVLSVTTANMNDIFASIRNIALVGAVIGLLSSLFLALMFKFMIEGVAQESEKAKTKIAVILFVVSGLLSVVLTFMLFPADASSLTTQDVVNLSTNATSIDGIGGIVSIIGYIFLVIAYKRTLSNLERGIVGQSAPMPVAPPQVGYAPPPPQ